MSTVFYQPGTRIWFSKTGQARVHEGVVRQYRENSGLILVEPVGADPSEGEWFLTHDINIVDYELPKESS